jgi:hypothetical protein
MEKNKRIHVINVKMNYKKSARSSPSAETRWRASEEAQTKRSLVLRGLTRRS